jgi:TRAP-type C4-dicarboxylate transport system permease small subunit
MHHLAVISYVIISCIIVMVPFFLVGLAGMFWWRPLMRKQTSTLPTQPAAWSAPAHYTIMSRITPVRF